MEPLRKYPHFFDRVEECYRFAFDYKNFRYVESKVNSVFIQVQQSLFFWFINSLPNETLNLGIISFLHKGH